jgi:hypothetical protein
MEFRKTLHKNQCCIRSKVTVTGQKFSSAQEEHSNTYKAIPRSEYVPKTIHVMTE